MVLLHKGKKRFPLCSGVAFATLLILLWGTIQSIALKEASAQDSDIILPGSGIHYPGGFDSNTAGEVQGKAYDFSQPEKGPVQFRIVTDKDSYMVIGSPRWYWSDLGIKVSDGTEVRVRGSKTLGKDGNLYIIAQEIRVLPSGKALVLREEDGYPIWKGPRTGTGGAQGGFGSSPRGMGGGFGGSGRGRR
jgi:hypothetical protein